MCYIASIFHVLTRFRAATLMLQTFQTTIEVCLGRGSILSDAAGVDGPIYLPSLPLLSYLDGLKPYLSYLFSFWAIDVIRVWLQLCYKSSMYCVVSALLIQGWHRSTVDVIHSGQVATLCQVEPLGRLGESLVTLAVKNRNFSAHENWFNFYLESDI